MNAWLAAPAAAACAAGYWSIGAAAARRRRMRIGSLPIALPAIVAVAAALAAATGAHAAAVAALAGVAVAGCVDARTGSIFDPLTATLLAASLALCGLDGTAASGACGALGVGTALFALHALTAGRGLGLGDVKLGAALGMALGVASGFAAIGLAFVFGGAYGVWLLVTRRARADASIRFGPFIAAGTFAALLVPAVPR
jgi:leader peptidase (prepilin peptidase) / N-methyltransferase